MQNFKLKTHRIGDTYHRPHFFILNKGLNSGKPLTNSCVNCFVCMTDTAADKDHLFWLCFGLWKTKAFHYFLRGSVIPFVSIKEIQKYLFKTSSLTLTKPDKFKKSIQALKLIDLNEKRLQATLDNLQKTRELIFYKMLNEGKDY